MISNIQKLSARSPGQPALGGPAWAGVFDQMTSRGPFQPQPSGISMNCNRGKDMKP